MIMCVVVMLIFVLCIDDSCCDDTQLSVYITDLERSVFRRFMSNEMTRDGSIVGFIYLD